MDSLPSNRLTSPGDDISAQGQQLASLDTSFKSQEQQQQPTQIYTTVGSVYNPQAAQPLQPPARRGRTIKWPPTPHSESTHSHLPKPTLNALPYRNNISHISQSPPNPLNSFHRYSPLRQNFDRAVSPCGSPAPHNLLSRDSDTHLRTGMTLPNMSRGNSPGANTAVGSDKHDDTNIYSDHDEDVEGVEHLKQMSVKTLTNLASYLNPMQRAAQKLLSRARPIAAATPTYAQARQSPLYHRPSGIMGEQRSLPLSSLRHTRSDPVAATGLQPERFDDNGYRNRSFRPPPGFAATLQKNTIGTGFQARRPPTPSASLFQGSGVPQPLMAGPPGQRHYRTPALESTFSAMQNGFRRTPGIDDDGSVPNPYNEHIHRRYLVYSGDGESSPSFGSERASSRQKVLRLNRAAVLETTAMELDEPKEQTKSKILADTLGADEVDKWYPGGIPKEFNYDIMVVPEDWTKDYPFDNTHERRRVESLATHMDRTIRHFYSGTDMSNKTIAEAIEEKNRRVLKRTLGVIGGERSNTKGRIENPKIAIEDAIKIPVHEHVKPLLSMALQTLANLQESPAHCRSAWN
ncbi:hypothetical protein DL764_002706 [Monosporascus ibericus]|uniref:Uncharacterized protein n=1 Tax=Monosporascus ibericus TaxID=155417 RepID=A0A4V1XBR4_9PEZI|nr:hypothetical protein DL764_002706 [Monosporascus ibericus]